MIWYLAVAAATITVVVFFVHLKKKQDALEQSYQRKFSGKDVKLLDKHATFIAQVSDGYSHFRGTGYLVLTDEEVSFERQLAKKVVSIPIRSITQVGETKRLAGQGPGRLMLKIDFINSDNTNDSIALCVKELDLWKQEIDALLR